MGNCLNLPSSSATVVIPKPTTSTATFADALTLESNSIVTDQSLPSPPSSPGQDAILSERKQEQGVECAPRNISDSLDEDGVDYETKKNNHESEVSQTTNNTDNEGDDFEDIDTSIEQQRQQGQRLLRELVSSGAETGDVDWISIIALAAEYHRKEQRLLRSYNKRHGRIGGRRERMIGSANMTNRSRQQAFFEKRRKKKEIVRRKKLESVGSFSVNLLLYDGVNTNKHDDEAVHVDYSQADNCEPIRDTNKDQLRVEIDEGGECSTRVEACPITSNRLQNDHDEVSSNPQLLCDHPRDTDDDFTHQWRDANSTAASNIPIFAVEGSFLAACSSENLREHDDTSSNSSSSSTTSNITFGRSWNDELITIDEEASIKMW